MQQMVAAGYLSRKAHPYLQATERESVPATLGSVRDIQAIRRQNLLFLQQECAAELGRERGATAALAARTGVPAPFLSMLLGKKLHSVTGNPRRIGDDTATKLETGMSKPPGWMDVDRTEARDFREAALLDKLRQLTASQRQAVERLMDEFTASSEGSSTEVMKPPPPSGAGQ